MQVGGNLGGPMMKSYPLRQKQAQVNPMSEMREAPHRTPSNQNREAIPSEKKPRPQSSNTKAGKTT